MGTILPIWHEKFQEEINFHDKDGDGYVNVDELIAIVNTLHSWLAFTS